MTEQQREAIKAYEDFINDAESWTFKHFKETAAPLDDTDSETTRYIYNAWIDTDENDENGGYSETITDEYPPLMDDRTLTPADDDTRQKVKDRATELINANFVLVINEFEDVTAIGIRSREEYDNNNPITTLYETLTATQGRYKAR